MIFKKPSADCSYTEYWCVFVARGAGGRWDSDTRQYPWLPQPVQEVLWEPHYGTEDDSKWGVHSWHNGRNKGQSTGSHTTDTAVSVQIRV